MTSGAFESQGTRTAAAQADEAQFRVEHALEAQSQGGLSGYLVEVANELVASNGSLEDPLKKDERDALTEAETQVDANRCVSTTHSRRSPRMFCPAT